MTLGDLGLTPELLAFLRKEEGFRSKAYLDQAGIPTIGYGHRVKSLNVPPVTREQAEEILRADLRVARNAAAAMSPNLLGEPQPRLAAVCDFCFNAGPQAYSGSTLRKRVNASDWHGAAAEMRKWVYAHDRRTGQAFIVAALVARRALTAGWLEGV